MAKTAVSDILVPDIWEPYVLERSPELSMFGQSGIINYGDATLNRLSAGGGIMVEMPYFKDLTATRQILSDSAALTVNKVDTGKDVARIHVDGQAWSVNILAEWLSGDDPMAAIGDFVAGYWARTDETSLIKSLLGVTGSTSFNNILSIASETIAGQTDATRLTGVTFIDALLKLGDRADLLTAIAMHSATEAALRKRNLIDFVPDSEGTAQIRMFQGRRVIVDDTLPTRAGTTDGTVYTSFLFGQGAFGRGAAPLDSTPVEGGFGTQGVEFTRDALGSDSILIHRRRYILHPRGVKWTDASVAGKGPTDAELATTTNWARVYQNKNVRIVAIEHNN